jgi:hypothetical protein
VLSGMLAAFAMSMKLINSSSDMWISLVAELFACSTSLKQLEKSDSWIRSLSGLFFLLVRFENVSKSVFNPPRAGA